MILRRDAYLYGLYKSKHMLICYTLICLMLFVCLTSGYIYILFKYFLHLGIVYVNIILLYHILIYLYTIHPFSPISLQSFGFPALQSALLALVKVLQASGLWPFDLSDKQ